MPPTGPRDAEPEATLPRAVAITWGMAASPLRGPKRELSHERIVEAAVALADTEGLSAVTMSRVASSLGFTTMSLYRYVTSKEELLQLMQDATAAVPVPAERPDQDWRSALREWALLVLGAYRDHPWMVELRVSPTLLMTPNNLHVVDLAMRAMRPLELSQEEKLGVLLALTALVRAYALLEHDLAGDEPGEGGPGGEGPAWFAPEVAALYRELVTPERFPDLAPLVQSGVYLGEAMSAVSEDGSDFEFGLGLMLDGVERYLERRGASQPPPAGTEPTPLVDESVRRDKRVREAVQARREAERRLRQALAKEAEAVRRAQQQPSG
ncbi:TetR family transcriptional regulator [Auraticoccus sp. F435]|uniref:TetR family transcriptional regulator n=1 Tax=Auraticoccus cholistanensis TaxID=2656650 RepID=A0A6A9UV80_9ACTN|nr:TetR/AcrR family transcriptional regulator [Auraticoccus cholistanensis]MVA76588.1 TetR family transcriptional regulator [Auraticoccus cholistanensis]